MIGMKNAERDTWCNYKKIKCITQIEYSDSVDKDGFVIQSIGADREIYEVYRINIVKSLVSKNTLKI